MKNGIFEVTHLEENVFIEEIADLIETSMNKYPRLLTFTAHDSLTLDSNILTEQGVMGLTAILNRDISKTTIYERLSSHSFYINDMFVLIDDKKNDFNRLELDLIHSMLKYKSVENF